MQREGASFHQPGFLLVTSVSKQDQHPTSLIQLGKGTPAEVTPNDGY